jgi:hypothetical protein
MGGGLLGPRKAFMLLWVEREINMRAIMTFMKKNGFHDFLSNAINGSILGKSASWTYDTTATRQPYLL